MSILDWHISQPDLGHVDFGCTSWYVNCLSQLLGSAAGAFTASEAPPSHSPRAWDDGRAIRCWRPDLSSIEVAATARTRNRGFFCAVSRYHLQHRGGQTLLSRVGLTVPVSEASC